jgi:hypothetical protein
LVSENSTAAGCQHGGGTLWFFSMAQTSITLEPDGRRTVFCFHCGILLRFMLLVSLLLGRCSLARSCWFSCGRWAGGLDRYSRLWTFYNSV